MDLSIDVTRFGAHFKGNCHKLSALGKRKRSHSETEAVLRVRIRSADKESRPALDSDRRSFPGRGHHCFHSGSGDHSAFKLANIVDYICWPTMY